MKIRFWPRWFLRREVMSGCKGGVRPEGVPPYLTRWTLLRGFGHALYLHKFEGPDWSKDCHDHPRSFWTIVFWGGYWEQSFRGGDVTEGRTRELLKAPCVRWRPAEHTHRVSRLVSNPTWTLVWMQRPRREWGWWMRGIWVKWDDYVFGIGQDRRADGYTGDCVGGLRVDRSSTFNGGQKA